VPVLTEAQLIDRARRGDRDAFAELYAAVERPLAAFVYRMLAIRGDAEDLAQETAVTALEKIGDVPAGVSFRVWIFRLAAENAFQYLSSEKTWDADMILRADRRVAQNTAARRKLQQEHKSRIQTTYTIREHIEFCFTCMGRTLPPHEKAALLLVAVHGFPVEDAAETLGIPARTLPFHVEQARQTLIEHYESRCSLINKDGSCKQCAGLDTLLYKDRRHTDQELFQIELDPRPTARERAQSFDQRLAIVRTIDPLHGEGARFHEFLMNFTRQASGY